MLRCFGVLESSLPQEFLVESRSPCFVKFSHSSRSSQAATAHHTVTTAAIIRNEIVCFTPDVMARTPSTSGSSANATWTCVLSALPALLFIVESSRGCHFCMASLLFLNHKHWPWVRGVGPAVSRCCSGFFGDPPGWVVHALIDHSSHFSPVGDDGSRRSHKALKVALQPFFRLIDVAVFVSYPSIQRDELLFKIHLFKEWLLSTGLISPEGGWSKRSHNCA